MRNIELAGQPLNFDKADEDLRGLLGKFYNGMTVWKDITVHVIDEAKLEDGEVKPDIDRIVSDYFRSHDPAGESKAEEARKSAEAARENLKALDVDALKAEVGKGDADAVLLQILDILKDLQVTLNR